MAVGIVLSTVGCEYFGEGPVGPGGGWNEGPRGGGECPTDTVWDDFPRDTTDYGFGE